MTAYVPSITQDDLDRELARGGTRAHWLLAREAGAMDRHIREVLRAEGRGFLSWGKGRRREELFVECLDALRAQVDLGRFTFEQTFGRTTVQDVERDMRRAARKVARS